MTDLLLQENKGTQPESRQETAIAPSAPGSAAKKLGYANLWDYVKSRFDMDNRFGSFVLAVNWIASYLKLRGTLQRKVNDGILEPDRTRALTYVGSLSGFTWSFLSLRGGKFPEGKTWFRRIINTIRHPQLSSTQFEFLAWFPMNVLGIYNNAEKGLKAYGIGLKKDEKAYAPEKIRLLSAVLTTAWQGFSGYGHFKNKEGDPPEEKRTPARPGFTGMLRDIWKRDRFLFLGAVFNISMQAVGITEGIRKWNTSRKEAINMLSGTSISAAMTTLYNLYIFQRIVHSNFEKKDEVITAQLQTSVPDTASVPPLRESAGSGFAQKVAERKQPHTEKPPPFTSFAEQASSSAATGMSY